MKIVADPNGREDEELALLLCCRLYVCKLWTLTAEFQRRIRAMKMRCYCKMLHISYKDHVTTEEVRAKIQQATGPHEETQTAVV